MNRTDDPSLAAKKAKRIASIIYLLVMAFVVGGTYISQQQTSPTPLEMSGKPL